MQVIDESVISDLKSREYEFSEVLGVEYEGKATWILCKCECGKLFRKKLRDMNNLHIHCGCKKSLLYSRAFHKRVANDPTYLKRRGESYSKWCKEHPDEVAAKGKRHSEKLRSDPEKLAEQGRRHSQWYKDNPEKVQELNNKKSTWFVENPDKLKVRSEKYSEWCKSHQEELHKRSEKYSEWCKNNHDKKESRDIAIKNTKKENRIKRLKDINASDLSYVHPDDIENLLSGNIYGKSTIRTRCPLCGEYFERKADNTISLNDYSIHKRMCKQCAISLASSHYEDEIYNYIVSLGLNCIRHDRSVIAPKELDLYIPDKHIAIEFNGNFWHDEEHKGKFYHYDKFIDCMNHGIRLISIYEYEYNDNVKLKKIMSCLNDALLNKNKISARKCTICKISNEDSARFFESYHIDGYSKQSSISYGLYLNNKLISCISFGKLRCQNSKRNNDGYYEIVRYATLPGTSIIGGLSKFIYHFRKDFNVKYLLSYSDNDYFSGNCYAKCGFSLTSRGRNSIDYNWINKNEYLTRQQCMVHKLLLKYPEYSKLEIIGSKEKYIMNDLGYSRIYRCGNSKWELYFE